MKLNCAEDKLNRSKHLQPLTKLLDNLSEESFVMTVSAPYGGGKTFFIDLWKKYLENNGYKTLYYNAWENDVADNPLMSFIASFDELGLDDASWKELIESAAGVFTDEVLLNPDIMGHCFNFVSPAAGLAAHVIAKGSKKIKEKYNLVKSKAECKNIFIEQVKNEKKKKEQILKLKEALKKIINKQKNHKLVIFIDDLDRCSPAYAIKFLEYIKHLFDVNGCIFVLAVDEEQLKSAVEVIYGNKNGVDFLAKIIDFKFHLPAPDISELIRYLAKSLEWGRYFKVRKIWQYTRKSKIYKFLDTFNLMAKIFHLSARDVLHICQDLNVVFKSHDPDVVSPTYLMLTYIIENYKHKIDTELQQHINQYHSYVKALDKYCSEQHYDFSNNEERNVVYPTNYQQIHINQQSHLTNFLNLLENNIDIAEEKRYTEAFFALSVYDFDKKQYKNVYENSKKIIEDILVFDKERETELQMMNQDLAEADTLDNFYKGPIYNDEDEDF